MWNREKTSKDTFMDRYRREPALSLHTKQELENKSHWLLYLYTNAQISLKKIHYKLKNQCFNEEPQTLSVLENAVIFTLAFQ